jgi:activating signal cointegrator 1
MKALTLTQPWASLVAIGAKRIETRSWSTRYRGALAIHAAKGFPGWAQRMCEAEIFRHALVEGGEAVAEPKTSLPRSVVLCTCNLIDCLPMEAVGCLSGVFDDYPELDIPQERAFGDFDVFDSQNGRRRYAWIIDSVKPLANPVMARGALGLWNWPG